MLEIYRALARSASAFLNTCALYRTEATATIAALKAKVNAAPQIVVKSCVASDILWGALGAGVGYVAHRR